MNEKYLLSFNVRFEIIEKAFKDDELIGKTFKRIIETNEIQSFFERYFSKIQTIATESEIELTETLKNKIFDMMCSIVKINIYRDSIEKWANEGIEELLYEKFNRCNFCSMMISQMSIDTFKEYLKPLEAKTSMKNLLTCCKE